MYRSDSNQRGYSDGILGNPFNPPVDSDEKEYKSGYNEALFELKFHEECAKERI